MRTSSLTTTTITIIIPNSSPQKSKKLISTKSTRNTHAEGKKIIYVWHCMARKKKIQNRYYAFTSINISDRLVFVNDIECNSNICSVAILCFMRIFYLGNTQYFLLLRSFARQTKKLHIQLSFGRTKN